MKKQKAPFIIQPSYISLKELALDYKDLLTYAQIRNYMNESTKIAFPSILTIAKLSGFSTGFILESIKRLEKAKAFKIIHGNLKSANRYMFEDVIKFEMIPKNILEESSLEPEEKAQLLAIRQFFNSETLQTSKTLKEMQEILDINYNTLRKHITQVKQKGIITKDMRYIVEVVDGQKVFNNKDFFVLNKDLINWQLNVEKRMETIETVILGMLKGISNDKLLDFIKEQNTLETNKTLYIGNEK